MKGHSLWGGGTEETGRQDQEMENPIKSAMSPLPNVIDFPDFPTCINNGSILLFFHQNKCNDLPKDIENNTTTVSAPLLRRNATASR